MRGISTDDIMQWSLDLAGLTEVPADSAIYVPGHDIRRVLFGIDVGTADLLLARQLGVDLVIAHHPADALQNFPRIFERHVALMQSEGIPEEEARAAIQELTERWRDRLHSANYDHVVSVAKLLGMPFMNIHNPLDEYGRQRMTEAVTAIKPHEPLSAVLAALNTIDEIRTAPTTVEIAVGSPESPAGRIKVVHGAGTNGGYPVATAYFRHGVQTVIYIHLATDAKWKLRQEARGQVIVVGHLAGDLTGIQPFANLLRARGLEVLGFSGVK